MEWECRPKSSVSRRKTTRARLGEAGAQSDAPAAERLGGVTLTHAETSNAAKTSRDRIATSRATRMPVEPARRLAVGGGHLVVASSRAHCASFDIVRREPDADRRGGVVVHLDDRPQLPTEQAPRGAHERTDLRRVGCEERGELFDHASHRKSEGVRTSVCEARLVCPTRAPCLRKTRSGAGRKGLFPPNRGVARAVLIRSSCENTSSSRPQIWNWRMAEALRCLPT